MALAQTDQPFATAATADEDLSDEQIEQLLQEAEARLREQRSLPVTQSFVALDSTQLSRRKPCVPELSFGALSDFLIAFQNLLTS